MSFSVKVFRATSFFRRAVVELFWLPSNQLLPRGPAVLAAGVDWSPFESSETWHLVRTLVGTDFNMTIADVGDVLLFVFRIYKISFQEIQLSPQCPHSILASIPVFSMSSRLSVGYKKNSIFRCTKCNMRRFVRAHQHI